MGKIKTVVITAMLIIAGNCEAAISDWSYDDKYLFAAFISTQVADYTQSIQINQRYREYCWFVFNTDEEKQAGTGSGRMECRRYRMYEEANPLYRLTDGGFNEQEYLLQSALFDISLYYFADYFPRLRKPLLTFLYVSRLLVVSNNSKIGNEADFPVLPIFITFNF